MASEITEEKDDENQDPCTEADKEEEKMKIRKIISYQKSLYYSSSSSSSLCSATASTSSFSSPRRRTSSSSLLDLMRDGSSSLKRLFDMEHTSLGNYFKDYSVSTIIKPILLWGSESDNDHGHDDPWVDVKKQTPVGSRSGNSTLSSRGSFDGDGRFAKRQTMIMRENRKRRRLSRTKSYKRLPRFSFWRCGVFRFRLRLMRRLRIVIRSKKLL